MAEWAVPLQKEEENRRLEEKRRAEEERRRLEEERRERELQEAARREQRYQEQHRAAGPPRLAHLALGQVLAAVPRCSPVLRGRATEGTARGAAEEPQPLIPALPAGRASWSKKQFQGTDRSG